GGEDDEDLRVHRRVVVADDERDRVFQRRAADRGQLRDVDAAGRQGGGGNRVGDGPVGAAVFAADRIRLRRFTSEVVVDRDVVRGLDEAATFVSVVAETEDLDVDFGAPRG